MGFRKFLEDKGVIEPEEDELSQPEQQDRPAAKPLEPPAVRPRSSAPGRPAAPPPSRPPVSTSTAAAPPASSPVRPSLVPSHSNAQPDAATYDKLLAQVNSAAPALYSQFVEKLQQMSFIANLTDRYKAALVAISTNSGAVLQSMQGRVKKLEAEERDYDSFIQSETERRVGEKRTRLDALKTRQADLNSKLEAIRNEIASATNDIGALETAIQADLDDIGRAAAVFKATAQEVRSTLEQEYQQTARNMGQPESEN
jgi:hypothetical protein